MSRRTFVQAADAERRLEGLQERCAAEEARLAALAAAGGEQARELEEQVRAAVELGQKVGGWMEGRAGLQYVLLPRLASEVTGKWQEQAARSFSLLPQLPHGCPLTPSALRLPPCRTVQVKAQSQEVAAGFAALQSERGALAEERAQLAASRAEAQAQQRCGCFFV